MLNFIWAQDRNGTIGYQGSMPWHSHEDMVHFRKLTTGHPVVMGRKTFESMGSRPLPHRDNYVLTHSSLQLPGVHQLSSLSEVKRLLSSTKEDIFVIGGATVFRQLLPLADCLYQTILDGKYPSDTKMPPLNMKRWHLVSQKKVVASRDGEPNCTFNTWALTAQ
ncbi:dihydrofolate reductase [Limosilactobacillus sp.]|uniref:dihydrofolate reductase n=1 Tax=Limosilactobacillus sp. TaxID=2773925 RepID=UPI00345E4988